MSSYVKLVDDATTAYIDAVTTFDEFATSVGDAVKAVADKIPAPSAPAVLPTVTEVLTANFAAADRLLATQKNLLLRLVDALPAPTVVVPQQTRPSSAKAGAKV